jgi:hypothetical protein
MNGLIQGRLSFRGITAAELPEEQNTARMNGRAVSPWSKVSVVEKVRALLRLPAHGRDVIKGGEAYQLQEGLAHCKASLEVENGSYTNNTYIQPTLLEALSRGT